MTHKDLTWVEAAILALNDSDSLWMTAPELVREIQSKGIKNLKSNYSQAVRTLRSALNNNSKKPHSVFLRSEGDFNVSFALRKRLNSFPDSQIPLPAPTQRRTSKAQQSHIITNGLPSSSPSHFFPPPHSPSSTTATPTVPTIPTIPTVQSTPALSYKPSFPVPETVTVEIDPSIKGSKPPRLKSESDVSSYICLPSPLSSILGPKKTLHVLNESTVVPSMRPVRQVRKKHATSDCEGDAPSPSLPNGLGPLLPTPLPEVLHMETCHSLSSRYFDVTCVRSPTLDTSPPSPSSATTKNNEIFEDPCHAQGERNHSADFELGSVSKRTDTDGESISSISSQSESDSEFESEHSDYQIQARPTSRLLVRRLSQQKRVALNIDYSRLGESAGEINEEEEEGEASEKEMDMDYVDPAIGFPRPRLTMKRQNRSAAADKRRVISEEAELDVDQKKSMSCLFQPHSPLLSENMKSILNMDAFMNLSESQRSKLTKFLPAVDRIGPSSISKDCLNNSFFSSALREWLEQVAASAFTPEYRVKMRADEKKRAILKAEDAWKSRFFEKDWGDRTNEAKVPDHTPYYPYIKPSSELSATCLKTILKSYYGEDLKTPPPTPPPLLPSATPSQVTPSFSTILPSSTTPCSPSSSPILPPSPPVTTSERRPSFQGEAGHGLHSPINIPVAGKKGSKVTMQTKAKISRKNHVSKKVAQKLSLPLLLGKPGKVAKPTSTPKKTSPKNSLNKVSASKVIEQLKLNSMHAKAGHNSGQFLTCLPPRTPYQSLLLTLAQASKPAKDSPHHDASSDSLTEEMPYVPPSTKHTHSVFHDHFALFSDPHIPSEFSSPITSLPLHLPIHLYTSCVCSRLTQSEHSYAKTSSVDSPRPDEEPGDKETMALDSRLSIPPSLVQTDDDGGGGGDKCGCNQRALVLCSQCHSLYHTVCSNNSTYCPTCTTIMSFNNIT